MTDGPTRPLTGRDRPAPPPFTIALLLAVAVAILVGVCVASDRDSADTPPTDAPASTNAPALSPGEEGSVPGGLGARVTIYGYSDRPSEVAPDVQPPEGTVYSVVDAQICAEATPVSFDPDSFTLVVPEGTAVVRPSFAREPALATQQILPNQCVRGFVTYQLPAGIRPIAVIFNDGTRSQTWLVR